MASKRPRRGPAGRNVLVGGDDGISGGPQGGAKPGASESGDLQAREYGVPQADIPGGVKHLVNPESKPAATTDKPRRPADYHKYHGVPSDDGQYYPTPGTEKDKPPKPEPEPKSEDAVPVYVVEGPGHGRRRIRTFLAGGRRVLAANAADGAVRLADRDPDRIQIWVCNETRTAANFLLIGTRDQIDQAITAGAAGPAVLGIPGNISPQTFVTQDELYCANTGGTALTVSWGYETEIEASGI